MRSYGVDARFAYARHFESDQRCSSFLVCELGTLPRYFVHELLFLNVYHLTDVAGLRRRAIAVGPQQAVDDFDSFGCTQGDDVERVHSHYVFHGGLHFLGHTHRISLLFLGRPQYSLDVFIRIEIMFVGQKHVS